MRKNLLALLVSFLFAMLLLHMFYREVVSFAASVPDQVVREAQQSGDRVYYYFPVVFNEYQPPTWEYIGLNGNVTDLIFDPDDPEHAFASVYSEGLFETYDNGVSWTKIWEGGRINDIAMHPVTHTSLYLAVWGSGIWRSNDGGDTWNKWTNLNTFLISVAVHPVSPTLFFAGSSNWELFGGHTFKVIDDGIPTSHVVLPEHSYTSNFAFDPISPTIMYAGTWYIGVKKSIDGGDTWYTANDGLADGTHSVSLIVHPENPSWLYAATSGGVYISYDRAESWQLLFGSVGANDLVFHPNDPATLYLSTINGFFVSHDAGANWSQLGQCGLGMSVDSLVLEPSDPNRLWAVTNNGLWRCIVH